MSATFQRGLSSLLRRAIADYCGLPIRRVYSIELAAVECPPGWSEEYRVRCSIRGEGRWFRVWVDGDVTKVVVIS